MRCPGRRGARGLPRPFTPSPLDGIGRTEERHRKGSAWDGQNIVEDLIIREKNTYDLAGRLTSTEDALNKVTSFAESVDFDAGLNTKLTTRTTYHPLLATQNQGEEAKEETVTYPDGSVLEVRRSVGADHTPVAVTQYEYETTLDSLVTREIRIGPAGEETEWVETHTKMGRPTKTRFADGAESTRTYEPLTNRPESDTDPDGVTTLYAYNARGERTTTAADLDADGNIDLAGTDRVTRTTTAYAVKTIPGGDINVRRTTTEVWPEDNLDNPAVVSVHEQAVSPGAGGGNVHQSWRSSGGRTVHAETVYPDPADGSWTVTTRRKGKRGQSKDS